MNDKERIMADILGVYYNSTEDAYHKTPDNHNFTMHVSLSTTDEGYHTIKYNVEYKDDLPHPIEPKRYNYRNDLADYLNNAIPNFYLGNKNVKADKDEVFTISIEDLQHSAYGTFTSLVIPTKELSSFQVIQKIGESLGSIPLSFTAKINIKRTTNNIYRTKVANQELHNQIDSYGYNRNSTEIANAQMFFKQVCNPDRDITSNNGYYSCSRYNDYGFRGTIKQKISRMNKESVIFVIEYLWGKKLNKTLSKDQLMNEMAYLPFNDFGIKDVTKMITVVDCLSIDRSIIKKCEMLRGCGLEPKTDLQRWQKVLHPEPKLEGINSL